MTIVCVFTAVFNKWSTAFAAMEYIIAYRVQNLVL